MFLPILLHLVLDYIIWYCIDMCRADMATIVHSDICSLLNGETLGKTKKTRKTKGSYPDPSKTIENNKKNPQKTKDLSNLGRGLNPIFPYYRENSIF